LYITVVTKLRFRAHTDSVDYALRRASATAIFYLGLPVHKRFAGGAPGLTHEGRGKMSPALNKNAASMSS